MTKKKKAGTTINFNDKVKIKGDFIDGDKITHNYGDIITNIQNNQTPEGFVQALQAVQGQLAALKVEQPAQKTEIEVAEGKLVEVAEASQSEQPNGAEIRKTLDEAKALLESIGGAATATIGLGAILAQIARMAIVVFGK